MGARVPYPMLRGTASAAIYYHFVVGPPGYASWCALGTLARYLVGNYTPPTPVATCNPVLGILTSNTGTAEQRVRYLTTL